LSQRSLLTVSDDIQAYLLWRSSNLYTSIVLCIQVIGERHAVTALGAVEIVLLVEARERALRHTVLALQRGPLDIEVLSVGRRELVDGKLVNGSESQGRERERKEGGDSDHGGRR
jgi:hypothetical protein